MPYSLPDKGRYPSLKEIQDTLHTTQGVTITHEFVGSKKWGLDLEGFGDENTSLRCIEYDGNELTPHRIYFEKGWPEVIVRTMEALSHTCGDFLIDADYGSIIVVSPGTDSNAKWYDFPDAGNDEPTAT